MKSNKQRRKALKTARSQRAERQKKSQLARARVLPAGTIAVDHSKLAPNNSYTIPPDYYTDQPFTCRDCGAEEVWTAERQKWWCEVAQGSIFSTAIRCRACRKIERDRKAEARRVHLEGIAKKQAQQEATD
ncbi:MAG: zinc-ribbon domain containing protein [Cyanobacteria bacterium P01_F01_bin.153]